MKNLFSLTTTALFIALAVFVSCGGGSSDPDPIADPCIALATSITQTATVTNVDGPTSNLTATWAGFQVTFIGDKDGGTFTTTVQDVANTASDQSLLNIWGASGTWTFTKCSDGPTVSIVSAGLTTRSAALSASSANMTLTFNVPTADTGGRTFGIPGDYVFTFAF